MFTAFFCVLLMLVGFGCGDGIPRGPSNADLEAMTQEQKLDGMKKMMEEHPQNELTPEQKEEEARRMRQAVREGTIEHMAEFRKESYEVVGSVRIIKWGEKNVVAISEDFFTEQGPYLVLALSPYVAPRNAAEMENPKTIHLGLLKTLVGGQLFEVPKEVDLSQVKSAVVYSKPFKVIFGIGTFIP